MSLSSFFRFLAVCVVSVLLPATASAIPAPQFIDCDGYPVDDYLYWNGICDAELNCEEWDFDNGDCDGAGDDDDTPGDDDDRAEEDH